MIIDASDFGLPPGVWPTKIETDIGNGLPFMLAGADVTAHEYRQVAGCVRLVVVDD